MNNNSRYEVDAHQLELMFAQLSASKQKNVYKQALRKSLSIILKQAKKNLRRKMGAAASHKSLKYHKKLINGIISKVARSGKSGKVHILKDFRLKFFEMGTNERHLRGGNGFKNRGKITANHFFKEANDAKLQEARDSIKRTLTESIIRINNRNR